MGHVTPEEEVYGQILKAIKEQRAGVVVTVIEISGSAPQKPGAKMLVMGDSQVGSVGGGAIENRAVVRAREILRDNGECEILKSNLSADLGMCCGGSMTLFFEPLAKQPQLVIVGAGHIAAPLCQIGALSGFGVTICDSREEWLTQSRFPKASRLVLEESERMVGALDLTDEHYVVLMSHEHAIDEEVAFQVLSLEKAPCYLGVIGSKRKSATLKKRLAEQGISQDRIDSIYTPIGLNIGAVSPEEIAISVAAELVAMRHGKKDASKW